MNALGAVVLCGGKSSRMGRPKALLPFGDEVLLQRVVRQIAEAAWPIVVVAAADQPLPSLPEGVLVARDPVSGRGPLVGLLAGLERLAPFAEAAFVSSTDSPFVHPAYVRRLAALRDDGAYDVVVVEEGGHHHALSALYACSVREQVAALLAANRLRPFFVFERVRTRVVTPSLLLADEALRAADPSLWSLRNVNTPEDYEAALRDAGA